VSVGEREEPAELAPGEVVGGRYRVEAVIGRGGLGVVYRATQLDLGRVVALKMMLPAALAAADGRARFRREAELAMRLEHPNTVRLYDVGEADDGAPFMVLEHLRGRTLHEELEAVGAMSPARVAAIGAQVCRSLMEAHALGIVHRDIKPSNLFLCDFSGARDFVKVLDFGIARQLGAERVTQQGAAIGTPAYMSPEQVRGGRELSPASDTYALGLVLAEALTSEPVFHGDSGVAVAMAQLSSDAPPLSADVLSSPLGAVIERATNKDIARRFATADGLLAALDATALVPDSAASPGSGAAERANRVALAPTAEISATRTGATTALATASTNRALLAVGGALGLVAAACIVFGVAARRGRATPPRASGEPTAVAPRPGPTAAPRAPGPAPRIGALTPAVLRERVVRIGYTVVRENKVDIGDMRGVMISTTVGAAVELMDFPSEARAAGAEAGYKRERDIHCLRSGSRVVLVIGPDSQRMFELVVRP
jgi:serine/threonine-protein kinase